MNTHIDLSNTADIIDSRDIVARIAEITDEITVLREQTEETAAHTGTLHDIAKAANVRAEIENLDAELLSLTEFVQQINDYAEDDAEDGVTLIRDSYFVVYAQELAEDTGALSSEHRWPTYCIDWAWAARELQTGYTAIDYNGVTYWLR